MAMQIKSVKQFDAGLFVNKSDLFGVVPREIELALTYIKFCPALIRHQ